MSAIYQSGCPELAMIRRQKLLAACPDLVERLANNLDVVTLLGMLDGLDDSAWEAFVTLSDGWQLPLTDLAVSVAVTAE